MNGDEKDKRIVEEIEFICEQCNVEPKVRLV